MSERQRVNRTARGGGRRALRPEPAPRATERPDRATRRHQLGRPDLTEVEIRGRTHRVAEVEPMDVDGVRTMTVGTIIWGLAFVGLLPFAGTLQADQRGWWLWTALAGAGLGLIGIEYCRRRRAALSRRAGGRRARR
ncbi:MAG: DUF2530 domain-containing protein [Gordonia sp. (in: high G+C Gram-positive bacteria)]